MVSIGILNKYILQEKKNIFCFVFLIKIKYFNFEIFRRAVSELYCLYIYIQDKLIINYVIQTQCQTNIILKIKIFLNDQD